MTDVTRLLAKIADGDPRAAEALIPLVYEELRKLARRYRIGSRESWADAGCHGAGARSVLATDGWPVLSQRAALLRRPAAEAMRHSLIKRARQRATLKRGDGRKRVPLDELARVSETPGGLLAVDEGMARYSVEEPEKANLVTLRFFGGLTMSEAATAMVVSLATAERWWSFSRAWLFAELSDPE